MRHQFVSRHHLITRHQLVLETNTAADTQHYYSTADVGNTGTGCEEYSEPAQSPNTAGIFNPTYMNKSAVMSNA